MLIYCFKGTNNDINVLDRSPFINDFASDRIPKFQYNLNGKARSVPYYLVDGIYPKWAIFAKSLSHPVGEKQSFYCKRQESVRKDIERAFGVLQSRFRILTKPCEYWHKFKMKKVIKACIILHNMIIEDKKIHNEKDTLFEDMDEEDRQEAMRIMSDTSARMRNTPMPMLDPDHIADSLGMLSNTGEHITLRDELMDHVWNWKGNKAD